MIKLWLKQKEEKCQLEEQLTHWGRVTHICVSKLTTIGSDNGLSPGRRQAIIWTNDRILLIRTLGTNFSEILSKMHSFSFKEMHFKMSSAKWHLFRLGLNELRSILLATIDIHCPIDPQLTLTELVYMFYLCYVILFLFHESPIGLEHPSSFGDLLLNDTNCCHLSGYVLLAWKLPLR